MMLFFFIAIITILEANTEFIIFEEENKKYSFYSKY